MKYNNNGNKTDTIPLRRNSHRIGISCANSKARPNQNLTMIASVRPTRTSMTSKISWRMTLILKKTNLKLWGEKKISKGNESWDNQNNYWDRKTPIWSMNGFSCYRWRER